MAGGLVEFAPSFTLGDVMNCLTWGTGLVGAALSARKLADAQRLENYTEIDQMYLSLLSMAIERPYLLEPAGITDPMHRLQYDTYAYAVWNFLETIFDRCRTDPVLRTTWYPVLAFERRRHRAWFEAPVNQPKFRQAFRDFVESEAYLRWCDGLQPRAAA